MQQFTRKPVKVYRWNDTGAPQIGVNTAGDFKTVLKACLNAGYGSKTALGWDIVGEDTNRIAVRSANAASTKSVLWVDDSHGKTAKIRAYESMTDLNTGTGRFESYKGNAHEYYPKTSSSGNAEWIIIGHDSAFAVFIYPKLASATGAPLFFGDFPSFKSGDQYNALLMAYMLNTNNLNEASMYLPGLLASQDSLGNIPALSRAFNQTTKKASNMKFQTMAALSAYPDPITGGWSAETTYIQESGSQRGILPGIYAARCFSNVAQFTFGQKLPQSADTADEFIWVRHHNHGNYIGFVVNKTAWLSP